MKVLRLFSNRVVFVDIVVVVVVVFVVCCFVVNAYAHCANISILCVYLNGNVGLDTGIDQFDEFSVDGRLNHFPFVQSTRHLLEIDR